tara:strand:+ start:165 stop:362 length:198 start_codon:yes stop_codon:yes gene_type:complete
VGKILGIIDVAANVRIVENLNLKSESIRLSAMLMETICPILKSEGRCWVTNDAVTAIVMPVRRYG